MISGSKLVLPMIVLNMGGEMVNILHQRLEAQNVNREKGRMVLQDVIRTMFSSEVSHQHGLKTRELVSIPSDIHS